MSENSTPNQEPVGSSYEKGKRPSRGRKALFLATVLLTGAIGGSFATKAFSHGPGWHGKWAHGMGSGITHVRGPMGVMGGPMDPAKMEKRAERMAKHLSVAVDATPQQTEKLVAIAKTLALDMAPLRADLRKNRQAAVDILASDNLDREALEKLRADQMTRWDQASKRMLQALTEASQTLTPQQRSQLHNRVKNWREARHGWWHGWKHGRAHHTGMHRGSYNPQSDE